MQGSFWKRALAGDLNIEISMRGFARTMVKSLYKGGQPDREGGLLSTNLVDRMRSGLERFEGPVLFLISGNDLVGREFLEFSRSCKQWKKVINRKNLKLKIFPDANHTMTKRCDLDAAAAECVRWLSAIP